MLMLGLPIKMPVLETDDMLLDALCDLANSTPAAAPPTPAAMRIHLARPLCDAEKTPSAPALGATESLRYCVLIRPARA